MYSELGGLKQVSHLVASCEVLVTKQCVKLVGTPEETRQAKGEIDHILVSSTSQILSVGLFMLVYFTLSTLLIRNMLYERQNLSQSLSHHRL